MELKGVAESVEEFNTFVNKGWYPVINFDKDDGTVWITPLASSNDVITHGDDNVYDITARAVDINRQKGHSKMYPESVELAAETVLDGSYM